MIDEGLVQNKLRDRLRDLERRMERVERYASAGVWQYVTGTGSIDGYDIGSHQWSGGGGINASAPQMHVNRSNMIAMVRFSCTFLASYSVGAGTNVFVTPFHLNTYSVNGLVGMGMWFVAASGAYRPLYVYPSSSVPHGLILYWVNGTVLTQISPTTNDQIEGFATVTVANGY